MEGTRHEENENALTDMKSENTLKEVDKSSVLSSARGEKLEIARSKHLETDLLTMIPEKTHEPFHAMYKNQAAELPEKHRALSEFFNRMTCSLRLLGLRKRRSTFENICRQVEVLTRRKFSYRHLAQIKFILPEAVQTDRILIHDEKTLCMKPELNVTLIFDVVEGHHEQSTYVALHQLFDARLFNFFRKHPEASEVPKAELPEPFNERIIATTDSLRLTLSTETSPNSTEAGLLNSSHLHPSFSRHFSQKDGDEETEKIQLLASPVHLSSKKHDCIVYEDTAIVQEKPLPDSNSKSSMSTHYTPQKVALEPENLMVETPAQLTPKRSIPTCDDKHKNVTSQTWMASNISTKRSLDFTYLESEESILDSAVDAKEQNNGVPETISQAEETGGTLKDDIALSASRLQKVEDNSCTDKSISACLSDLVTIINNIFQSANRSSITKEELVHKIIMNNCDIVESREVEEQMDLLEKFVPDWFCKKLAPSGDLLYNIKKVPDLSSVCERLVGI